MKYRNVLKISISVLVLIVLISGCGSDSTVTPNPPTTGTVSGKVIDFQGNPISGVTTAIGGQNTVTGADGSFTINNVTTPYDVKLVLATSSTGIMYQGISTLTPQLLGLGLAATPATATLIVNIPTLGVNQKAAVIYTDNALVHSSTTISNPPYQGTFSVTWQNTAPITGKVIVLVYTVDALGAVTSYDKYGERQSIALNNGGTSTISFAAGDLNVTPTTLTVSGTITAPAGFNPPVTRLNLKFTTQGTPLIGAGIGIPVIGQNYSYKVPGGITSTYSIGIQGSASSPAPANEQTLKLLTATVGGANNITLETPCTLGTPVAGATNVDTTTNFTLSAGTGSGINILVISTNSPQVKRFYLMTTSTSVTIPSFSAFGLPLPTGAATPYTWGVVRFGSLSSINDFVSTGIYNNPNFNVQTQSQQRTFTTP